METVVAEGREIRVQRIQGGGGRSEGWALYVNDELRVLGQLPIPGRGRGKSQGRAQIFHFGGPDGSSFAHEHDLPQHSAAQEEAGSPPQTVMGDFPEYCEIEIFPSPECEGWECGWHQAAVYAAYLGWIAAESAYMLAVLTSGPISPQTAAAAVALSVASTGLFYATTQYQACLAENSGGGGGSPDPPPIGDGPNCETYIVEVSYDDGVTWEYLTTIEVCD